MEFNRQTKVMMGAHYTHEVDARELQGMLEDGAYQAYEIPLVINAIQHRGYDGIYMCEEGQSRRKPNLAVFDPCQIKSATDNHGFFDPGNPDITDGGNRQDANDLERALCKDNSDPASGPTA